jgi:hypothetical protein
MQNSNRYGSYRESDNSSQIASRTHQMSLVVIGMPYFRANIAQRGNKPTPVTAHSLLGSKFTAPYDSLSPLVSRTFNGLHTGPAKTIQFPYGTIFVIFRRTRPFHGCVASFIHFHDMTAATIFRRKMCNSVEVDGSAARGLPNDA